MNLEHGGHRSLSFRSDARKQAVLKPWSCSTGQTSSRCSSICSRAGIPSYLSPKRSQQVATRALFEGDHPADSNPSSNSGSSTRGSRSHPSKPSQPKPLNPTTADQLLKHLQTLTFQPRTPFSPLVGLAAPTTQSALNRCSPSILLGVLQLFNSTGYSPSAEWLSAWGAAVEEQLPRLSSDVACCMIAEVLRLKQPAHPQGLLDNLFVGALRDVDSCSSSSIVAALAAIAAAELSSSNSWSSPSSSNSSAGRSGPDGRAAAVVAAAAVHRPTPAAATPAALTPWQQLISDQAAVLTTDADQQQQQQRPGSFASLISSSSSSTTNRPISSPSSSSSSSAALPVVGPLSSWEDLAAAAVDLKPNAPAATAAQKDAYAAEAAAAGAAAIAAQQTLSSSSSRGVNIQDLWQQGSGSSSSSATSSSSGDLASTTEHISNTSSILYPSSNGSSIGGSSSSTSNIALANWLGGYSSSSSIQHISGDTHLYPIALHSWIVELGQPGRLQQLQPDDVAVLTAAVAALQLRMPAAWLESLFGALQQHLASLSPAAMACLSTSLPLLLPDGGALRLWRQLGTLIQQQGRHLSAGQLCEVLPLVQAADLAVPTVWLEQAVNKIQGSLSSLSLPQSSRALVSSVALGYNPPKPWLNTYMQRFRSQLSELNPEGLVDVLRALSKAGALPSHEWLLDFERDVGRRFGFIGPVELSTMAFLFANLAHIPSDTWKQRFLVESLKFRVYYTGSEVTQVVWSAVRLGCKPEQQWLKGYAAQMREQLKNLQAYQIAFTFAALQKLGAPLEPSFIDDVLDAYVLRLGDAQPSDTALVLVTVARLQHVTSYRWLEDVLDNCQARMLQYDGPELITLLWSLAKLHHQPGPEWLNIFCEAAEGHLAGLTGSQLAQLLYGFAQLNWEPPAEWLESFLSRTQGRLDAGEFSGRDAASLLSSLATLRHTPTEQWLHSCLSLLYFRLPELDPEGIATVAISLAKLNVVISNGQWLENYISLTLPRLSGMTVETQVNLVSALAAFGADLPKAWVAAFQLQCVQQAEARKMTAAQLEQVLVALGFRSIRPSSALCQLYFDASLPELAHAKPDALAAVLQALQQAAVQPDAHWLEALVGVVRDNLRSYSLVQLNVVAKSLAAFEAGGIKQPWLSGFVSYLKEFFLY